MNTYYVQERGMLANRRTHAATQSRNSSFMVLPQRSSLVIVLIHLLAALFAFHSVRRTSFVFGVRLGHGGSPLRGVRSPTSLIKSCATALLAQNDPAVGPGSRLPEAPPAAEAYPSTGSRHRAGLTDTTVKDLLPSLPDLSLQILADRGIQFASPIQTLAMPHIAGQKNALLHSQTGSGKTMAFLLPALEVVRGAGKQGVVLVVTPTRELAVQIMTEAEDLCHGDMALITIAAQASWERIASSVLIVATPNELLERFDNQDARLVKHFLERVQICVLDEFDELLPRKSFEGKRLFRYQDGNMWPTEGLLKRLIRNNQNSLLQVIGASATAYKPSRAKLIRVLRRDPLNRFKRAPKLLVPGNVPAETLDEEILDEKDGDTADNYGESRTLSTAPRYASLPPGISHYTFRVPVGGSHANCLSKALDILKPDSALVFVCPNAEESVRSIVGDLQRMGWSGGLALNQVLFPDSRHAPGGSQKKKHLGGEARGWRSSDQLLELRELTSDGWKSRGNSHKEAPILISAEESVRGLHLDAVEAVFIIGLPKTAASYMHMAGRTGRLPHPFGNAVLVARGREIAKVKNGFAGQTTIRHWTDLNPRPHERRRSRDMMDRSHQHGSRETVGRNHDLAYPAPKRRSAAAEALDAALGPALI